MSEETQVPERPATFREVFTEGEFRSVYLAVVLTWAGDYIAKAAITMLVFQQTNSVALSAAAFATSYFPWLLGGPLLTTLADRYPYRTVMVVCDLARMPLFLVLALVDLPVGVLLGLLFVSTLAAAPSQASRSAMVPLILRGDRLVVGLSLFSSSSQASQIGGYVAGSSIALYSPRLALLINAVMFGLSALIIWTGVRHRPPAPRETPNHLLRDTAAGFRLVFGTPTLRAIAILIFSSMLFAIVPEGLAAAWASDLAEKQGDHPELIQALIMASVPTGSVMGALLVGRVIRPARRQALIRPFAVLAPLALVPALLSPSPVIVALLAAVAGFAVTGLIPVTNALFVQALPDGYRARAFGVMNTGMQAIQGTAVLITGVLAERFPLHRVVGLWSVAGVLLMLLLAARWPQPDRFTAAIARAREARPTGTETSATPTGKHPLTGPPGPRPPSSEAGIGAV
ncbi:MFS transporter [Plantactinospora sp. B24E8]|uniref:MFS transporter n=1 Tax=Plantactinospora sp. B24E8 TaxID=3153567 RepID=UPI00325F41ED